MVQSQGVWGLGWKRAALAAALLVLPCVRPVFAETPAETPVSTKPLDVATDPDIALAFRMERAFQKIAEKVRPSSVSITVTARPGGWRDDLQRIQEGGGFVPERKSAGSGVIIEADGKVLTNEHVIRNAEEIRVMLSDGSVYKAEVVGSDARSDLAVIKPLQPLTKQLIPAPLADSDHVEVGQWALALGNPYELSNTLTVGVVSARGRSLPRTGGNLDAFYGNLIQTDTPINPGNSGGPLFNLHGELVGINTMIYSKSGRSEGFGFAIPSNDIKPRLANLRLGRAIEYGWLGVVLRELEPGQTAFPSQSSKAVLVDDVMPDSPADRAGIQRGSVVLTYDGMTIAASDELILAVGRTPVGKVVKMQIRDPKGSAAERTVRVGLRSSEMVRLSRYEGETEEPPGTSELLWRGMRVKELPAEEAAKNNGHLRITRIKKGSPADRAGLYEGAFIDEIKTTEDQGVLPVQNIGQLRQTLQSSKGQVYIRVPVGGYILVEPDEK